MEILKAFPVQARQIEIRRSLIARDIQQLEGDSRRGEDFDLAQLNRVTCRPKMRAKTNPGRKELVHL